MAVKLSILSDFAIQALKANKMRSFLTMLGIIIGVGAVVLMMAIGNGEQQQVEASLSRLGTNLLQVMPSFERGGVRITTAATLTLGDANAVAALPGVAAVAPSVRASGLVTYGDQTDTTSTTGTTPAIVDLSSLTIAQGRFFDDSDVQSIAPVAVLGQTPYQALYPDGGNPVGTQIRIKNVSFTVIGLLQTVGASMGGADQDDVIYIPVTTAQIRLQGITNKTINSMEVQAASKDDLTSVQNALEAMLRKRHRLNANQQDDFNIRNLAQIQQTASNITGEILVFLISVAAFLRNY